MKALSLEDVGAPGATGLFSMETILNNMEVGRYVGPIFPGFPEELVNGRCVSKKDFT